MTIRPNEERARKAISLMKATVIGTAAMSLVHIYSIYFFTSQQQFVTSIDQLMTYGLIVGGVGLLFMALYIVNIVFFLQWFRRAYFNMHVFFKSGLRYSEGMAAGAWFIPIFNLWGPHQIAKDLSDKSSELLKIEAHDEQQKSLKSTINLWWGLWITSTILSSVGNQLSNKQIDKDLLITGSVISFLATIISVVAGIYCIKFIRKYSATESELSKMEGVSTSQFSNGNTDLLDSVS